MKNVDVKVNINPDTYEDEFVLILCEDKKKYCFTFSEPEFLDFYQEIKQAVESNIC